MKRRQLFTVSLAVAVPLTAAMPTLAQQAAAQPASAAAQPAGRIEQGVFVPEGNTLAEVLEQQAANKGMAAAAQQQTADNKAMLDAYAQAKAAYDAEVARLEEERRAKEAEAARIAAEHEAAMAKWRADVAACKDGDKSRCAPPAKD